MKNITLKIDDDTHRKARVKAAEEGTSLSAVTRNFLDRYARDEEIRESDDDERRKILRDLWAKIDAIPKQDGPSFGPFNRDECYDRHEGKFES